MVVGRAAEVWQAGVHVLSHGSEVSLVEGALRDAQVGLRPGRIGQVGPCHEGLQARASLVGQSPGLPEPPQAGHHPDRVLRRRSLDRPLDRLPDVR